MREINKMRNICQADLQQMYHCRQCRADAVGLLGEDRSLEFFNIECCDTIENGLRYAVEKLNKKEAV